MKAIILTYAEITKEEEKLLKNTNIFKIATNYCRAELKPNLRLCADNIVDKCLECDTCDVVSLNYDTEKERVINGSHLPDRHSSLLGCLDYLYLNGYTSVLLVANNLQANDTYISKEFQELNRKGVNALKGLMYMYKYSLQGKFDIPTLTIKEFLEMNEDFMPLTEEDKLLGLTEPRPKTLLEKIIFTEGCKFEVHTEGRENKSIVSGEMVANLLPQKQLDRLQKGEMEIIYNGTVIRRLTDLTVKPQQEKVDISNMTYKEMLAFCKENNIKTEDQKKPTLIKAIKEFNND